ncbi:MAG: hydrogenase iron-sulfur subunit [Coriobacteriales bacterium]|jgi:coenzyme F420-reducing hydrogenase delta subunit|nr:hydrogenase iron-sulfur subunit [Coriobacteriales bacterium]
MPGINGEKTGPIVAEPAPAVAATGAGAAPAAPPPDFEPTILAFACHWCTYSGADLAGLNRMNYPANVRVLRVPCSGRVNPQHALAALNKGVDGVLICGCHPGDCHYVSGNYFAKRRLMAFKRLLEYTGLEPERFQVRWISGSEAGKFRDTVISVCEQVRKLGPYVPDPGKAPIDSLPPRHSEGGDAQ